LGHVAGMLGLGGGAGGTGFAGPASANLLNPATTKQANTAYDANQAALAQQQAFVNALQAQNGIQNQSNVFNQLQNIASGQGPNPAQAMLANATGANTANQAALMASQRGAAVNPALIARQAAMQGAANQQNAAGQAAALQAQQSLGALGQMGGLASTQVGQQQAGVQNLTAAQQAEQAQILNQINAQNQANIGMQSNINTANAGLAGAVLGNTGKAIGGAFQGLGLGAAAAEGGSVENLPKIGQNGPQSIFGQYLTSPNARSSISMAEGGKVPALVSPGERYLPPSEVKKVADGKKAPMEAGEKIPGKPKVGGAKNDYANDTVPKTLEEGGIVLPRSVTQSKNPHWAAHKFVSEIMAKNGHLPPKKKK